MKNLTSSILGLAILLFTFISCNRVDCISGNGKEVTRNLSIEDIRGVDIAGSEDVNISQGATQQIEIIGDENIVSEILENVTDGIWRIGMKSGCYNDYDLEINITIPDLDVIQITGSAEVNVGDFANQSDLSLKVSGSGQVTLNKFDGLQNLVVVIRGSGDVIAKKTISPVDYLDVNIGGSGSFHGFPVESHKCDISISGSGSARVYAIDALNGRISGSGDIEYKGDAEVEEKISGSGSIRKQ